MIDPNVFNIGDMIRLYLNSSFGRDTERVGWVYSIHPEYIKLLGKPINQVSWWTLKPKYRYSDMLYCQILDSDSGLEKKVLGTVFTKI